MRYAPSPTGALHLGGLRTALFNFALAQQARAREAAAFAAQAVQAAPPAPRSAFILRIEDTDRARNVAGSTEALARALEWCGLRPDEGPGLPGGGGPP